VAVVHRPTFALLGSRDFASSVLAAAVLATPLGHAAVALAAPATRATYYVSPSGNDAGPGAIGAPFATIAHAQSVAAPGDTVYLRGGRYAYTAGTSACASPTAVISAIELSKSGAPGSPIEYLAYPGEKPVFDFSGIKDSCRVKGFLVSGSWLHLEGLEVTGAPQNNTLNHESWGMWISGSNDVFERLDLHHNMGPGLFIQDGGGNLVLDCDSHENYDPLTSNGAGQSADGFGCHIAQGGTGNVFRGCRAWWNSDDGWDFIQAAEVVTVEKSWSWYNGYLPGTMTPAPAGNGNGFKGGGFGVPETKVPASPPSHVIRNCLSFLNKAAGFYANHEPVADHFYNNTAYANHPDFDLLGMLPDGTVQNLGILRNNLAYGGTLLGNATGPMVDASNDSWDLSPALTVGDGDFLSTSVTGMDGPRQADGSLPCVPFMRLSPTSQLIDKGVDVGIAFLGAAPDLGAFEQGACVSSPAPGTGGGPGSGGAAGMTGMTGGAGMMGMTGGATATGGSGGSASGGAGGSGGFGPLATGGTGPAASGGAPVSGGAGGAPVGSAGASPPAGGPPSSPGVRPPGEGVGGGGCTCALDRTVAGHGAGASGTEGQLATALGALLALTIRRRRAVRPIAAQSVEGRCLVISS
jgi:hypothetical protein